MRRFAALASDYDGTLAHDGTVDEPTVDALRRARKDGLRLLMVTGRVLPDLLAIFPQLDLFHLVVAENGATLYDPASGVERMLAEPVPPALVRLLIRQHVPVSVGRTIVAAVAEHAPAFAAAIQSLGLDWHLILNKGSVMALPAGIDKAAGLAAALETLGVRAADTIAIGDAENDHAFLRMCGVSVAVANALPSLKAAAHVVTSQPRGAGVVEALASLIPYR
jgi:hydroxymethylpyrimidine pyrophosphatase-like HAD family hydrolase